MRGRVALAGLTGLVGGATLELLLALAFVYLWFTVLKLPAFNGDPKPGITMLGGVVPISTALGALVGAVGVVRRAKAGHPLRAWLATFAGALVVALAGLAMIVA
ncbi:hypothetical protein [Sphingomonas jeddahensis]|uniref:Uncharacterized protein n=1 Tax=Sphingomonas jeddahensis TaxID=1915074 RepID=A0A1V2EUL2_9SPHN|nr:hypothetical protein [Sphingomonas jeddahensis]ONF96280.1 hypothetical protein SPHI_15090 [Sphingomonas jeddahensis]